MTALPAFSSVGLAVVAGALAAAGLALMVLGAMRRPVSLKEALAELDHADTATPLRYAQHDRKRTTRHDENDPNSVILRTATTRSTGSASEASEVAGSARLETWSMQLATAWHLPMTAVTKQRLAQQNRTPGDFMTAKLLLALAGLTAPALITGLAWLLGLIAAPWPLGLGLVGAALGFFWPDFALRQDAGTWAQSSADAVSVYFDLVTLIRLGNASAVQALTEAANLADAPVFVEIRDALTRARLQQRPPWAELHALADRLDLPDIADLADIMALDEQGAALVDALRARVRELRKAHLASAKLAAQKQAESMTVWMVVPVLVFALLFLIPPLMTMMSGL